MRTILVVLTLALLTPALGLTAIVAELARVPHGPDSIYERCARLWARSLCRAAGVEIVVHHPDQIEHEGPRIYASNHVSWFDIFALASILPRYTFIAKRELQRIPLFGRAARAVGIVFIDRQNRAAAFEAYGTAASQVQGGRSVVVCPEGTRGRSYALRPFKKGPFVFAIAAGAPVVPTVVYGAREVQPRGSVRVRPGRVEISLLEPVPTAGLTYEDRHRLMEIVWQRMATELRDRYGVESDATAALGAVNDPDS